MPLNKAKVNTYRRIVSSTAAFGSAQMLNLLVGVLRGKLVASILHSTGMGVLSVFNNVASGFQQFALMGLNISTVRNISQAHDQDDEQVLDLTIRIVRTLVLIASMIGLTVTLVLSPFMSGLSFGNDSYTTAFVLLGAAVFFGVLAAGETSILQGMRRYKRLALCSVFPPLCGLLLSIPIYYIWGVSGIVPAMILLNVVYFAVLRYYSYRNPNRRQQQRITLRQVWTQGQGIIQFGFVMTLSVLAGSIATYALSIFIINRGSVSDLGFYQAGTAITTQYIGLVFTAMATDYYPHLSSLVNENMLAARRLVNQQVEMVLLIVTPIVMLIILTAPVIISILLTNEFQSIRELIRFLGLATILKAISFPLDYIAYAKGDRRYLFWVECVLGNVKTLLVMAGCYYFMGFSGLGYGALASALLDVVFSITLTRWRYGFRIMAKPLRLAAVLLLLAGGCMACSYIDNSWASYGTMATLTAVATVYCLTQLNKRIDLKAAFRKWRKRQKGEPE
mgnify:CR=1 FL=1